VRLRLAALEKDAPRATALYESALRLSPSDTIALVNLGALYAGSGRTAEATLLWARALETNPAIEEAALNLAQVLPPSEAQAVLKRYLAVDPASTAVIARLAEKDK
jgi:tetratricopeptide (TPR) repeat protein